MHKKDEVFILRKGVLYKVIDDDEAKALIESVTCPYDTTPYGFYTDCVHKCTNDDLKRLRKVLLD